MQLPLTVSYGAIRSSRQFVTVSGAMASSQQAIPKKKELTQNKRNYQQQQIWICIRKINELCKTQFFLCTLIIISRTVMCQLKTRAMLPILNVCGLKYPSTQRACAVLYCHLWLGRLYYIYPHYLINDTVFGKNYWTKTCVLYFQVFLKHLCLWRIQRGSITNT